MVKKYHPNISLAFNYKMIQETENKVQSMDHWKIRFKYSNIKIWNDWVRGFIKKIKFEKKKELHQIIYIRLKIYLLKMQLLKFKIYQKINERLIWMKLEYLLDLQ